MEALHTEFVQNYCTQQINKKSLLKYSEDWTASRVVQSNNVSVINQYIRISVAITTWYIYH